MHKLKNKASRKGKDRRASSSTETTPVKQSKSRKLDTEEKDVVPLSLSSVYSSGEPDTNMEAEPAPMGHRPRPSPNLNDEEAPRWFREFEKRQDHRFNSLLKECRDAHETLRFDMNIMKDTVEKLQKQLTEASDKMDELENRNRRNNVVIFNLPEGAEGSDCAAYVKKLLKDCKIDQVAIQRAHRSGPPRHPGHGQPQKPRPIHVGFLYYPEKERCRKALIELFKKKEEGPKLFVSNDYSVRVQKMRREKIPELRRLRANGQQAVLIFPATIKVRDSATGLLRDP